MALSRAYLRSHALSGDAGPASTLQTLNQRILEDTSSDLFVTVVYVLVEPNSSKLLYGNGGHPPPLVVRANPALPSLYLTRTGMAVGAMEDATYEQGELSMQPGDFVVIYSDGLTDATNSQGEAYGMERLQKKVEALRGLPPYEVRVQLTDALREFTGGAQDDDVTVVVLGREIA